MTPLLVAQLLALYGPAVVPVLQKLFADIQAGRQQTTVTSEDLAELQRLSALSAASIFKREGIALPPA